MINGRVAILRIVTCAIGGVVFPLLLFSFIPYASGLDARVFGYEAHVWDSYAFLPAMGLPFPFILSIVGIGALLGLLPGIAWAIDHRSAAAASDEEVERLSKRFSEILESGKLTSEPQEGKSTG